VTTNFLTIPAALCELSDIGQYTSYVPGFKVTVSEADSPAGMSRDPFATPSPRTKKPWVIVPLLLSRKVTGPAGTESRANSTFHSERVTGTATDCLAATAEEATKAAAMNKRVMYEVLRRENAAAAANKVSCDANIPVGAAFSSVDSRGVDGA
jgi:hypothetical protein